MDFTLKIYQQLLESIIAQGYTFQPFADFLEKSSPRCILLRQDLETRYGYALRLARIQHKLGIRGTYYCRFLPNHFDTGIIGEPYFDTDFSKVLYLTDTGRRWDGEKVSVRDKVSGQRSAVSGQRSAVGSHLTENPGKLEHWNTGTMNHRDPGTLERETWNLKLKFHSTRDIISAANGGLLPDQVMFTFHPQRWTDEPLPWIRELVMQNVKNVAKWLILSFKP